MAQGRKILRLNGFGSYLRLKRRGQRIRTVSALLSHRVLVPVRELSLMDPTSIRMRAVL